MTGLPIFEQAVGGQVPPAERDAAPHGKPTAVGCLRVSPASAWP
jgi:hypothetical protein